MGLDQTIRFPTPETPGWEAIRDQLLKAGETPVLRMIDGLPAFPDEIPEPGWKEIRLGFAAGMVSVVRGVGLLKCVIWGNSDDQLKSVWCKVVWACAEAGSGQIVTSAGPVTAGEFAKLSGFSPS
jgi:hypothetical protein